MEGKALIYEIDQIIGLDNFVKDSFFLHTIKACKFSEPLFGDPWFDQSFVQMYFWLPLHLFHQNSN